MFSGKNYFDKMLGKGKPLNVEIEDMLDKGPEKNKQIFWETM